MLIRMSIIIIVTFSYFNITNPGVKGNSKYEKLLKKTIFWFITHLY